MADKLENFKKVAPIIFKDLIDKYGYTLDEVKTNQINNQDWSVHLIYTNKDKGLKIITKQEPFYTDYGFSFFIYKLGTKEYNILCNVEHHRQDTEGKFLVKAYIDLFTTKETLDIITGNEWQELKRIPFLTA
jgi:hypothetical protein